LVGTSRGSGKSRNKDRSGSYGCNKLTVHVIVLSMLISNAAGGMRR
jgi:hypothetical protein